MNGGMMDLATVFAWIKTILVVLVIIVMAAVVIKNW